MNKSLLPALLIGFSSNLCAQKDSAAFYFKKGKEEKMAQHWLMASKHFEKAIAFDASSSLAYMENGLVNLQMKKTDAAKTNFTKAYELDPSNKVAATELMQLHFNYRQWEKAMELAQRCKNCEGAERIIAVSYYQQEDYPQAESALLKLTAAEPDDAVLNYTLAKTYIELEEEKKATAYFRKAVELDTTKISWMLEFADNNYENLHYKDAVIYYKMALANGYKPTLDFNTDLGFSYIYSGEYQKGEDLIKSVIDKNSGKKDLYRDVADAFYNRRMYDKTLEYCQKLIDANPKDAKALYQAGLAYIKKDQKERGQALCDQAIALDPSLKGLKKQLGSLGGL